MLARESVTKLEKVGTPATERVPVAVMLEAVRPSLKNPAPATESLAKGVVVPMPTLPVSIILMASVMRPERIVEKARTPLAVS